jgi:hypothetical protein
MAINNLKQVGLAVHNYEATYGHLPADVYSKDGKPLWSWRVLLLPFMEQDNLYKSADLTEPWDSPKNKAVSSAIVKVFSCGAEPAGEPMTCFKRPTGPGTAHEPGRKIKWQDFLDGMSNTILVVEAGNPVPWAKPGTDFPLDPKSPQAIRGPYAAGLVVLRGDGSVATVPGEIPAAAAKKLSLIADGEPVTEKDWAGTVTQNLNDPKELADLQKEVRALTDEAVKGLQDMVKLEEAVQRYQTAQAEKKGNQGQAMATRVLNLYQIIDGLQARRKRIADDLGVSVDKLDEVVKTMKEQSK